MRKILAIDGSTKSTGIAVFNDDKLIHYECVTASSTDVLKRINKMVSRIEELYKEYEIDTVMMEDVLPEDVKHNAKVYKALIYLQAAVVLKLHDYNQTVEFCLPSEWRAKCKIQNGRGIKRESAKAYDMAYVKEHFNIDVNDDVADAICIGIAYNIANPTPIILEGGFQLG